MTDDVRALQCDHCTSQDTWKCIDCMELTKEVYDHMLSANKCELKWFCNKCDSKLSSDESLSNQNKLDRITMSCIMC